MAHRFFRYITRVFLGETPWPLVSASGIVITAEAGLIGAPAWLTILGAGVAAAGLLGTINHPGEPKGEPLIIGGERVGTRVAGGVIVLSPGYDAEQLDQHQLPDSQPYQDQSGNITGEAKDVL